MTPESGCRDTGIADAVTPESGLPGDGRAGAAPPQILVDIMLMPRPIVDIMLVNIMLMNIYQNRDSFKPSRAARNTAAWDAIIATPRADKTFLIPRLSF